MEKYAVPCLPGHSNVKMSLPILDLRADIKYRWPIFIPERMPQTTTILLYMFAAFQTYLQGWCFKGLKHFLRGSTTTVYKSKGRCQHLTQILTLGMVVKRIHETVCLTELNIFPHFTHWFKSNDKLVERLEELSNLAAFLDVSQK